MQDDSQPEGTVTPNLDSSSGSVWSIMAGLAVFAAILWAVWYYLYPRLSGEVVSSTAQAEVCLVSPASRDGWSRTTSLAKKTLYRSPQTILTTRDLTTFRGFYHAESVGPATPMLTLHLNAEGVERLRALQAKAPNEMLGLIIHGTLVGTLPLQERTERTIEFELQGVSRDDAEQAFARLTQ
jgi:hypothetical protein